MPAPADLPLSPAPKTPAEEEAALAAEIEKRAADARLKRGQESALRGGTDGDGDYVTDETPEDGGERRGFWSRLFRRGQDEDKVAEFYGEPEAGGEMDEDETEDYAVPVSTPSTTGENDFFLKSSDDLETGTDDAYGDPDPETEDEEFEDEAPVSAPPRRVASVEVPLTSGRDDRGPVVITREVQVPITLGPEDVLRGARLRLVLEIQVEAAGSDEDSDRQSRVA
jgi:hypothetical protein